MLHRQRTGSNMSIVNGAPECCAKGPVPPALAQGVPGDPPPSIDFEKRGGSSQTPGKFGFVRMAPEQPDLRWLRDAFPDS
jgi:hypothetical protein